MKSSGKAEKYSKDWHVSIFKNYIVESNLRETYSDLYDEIYKYYKPKIEKQEIDITKERIFLEAKAGKYKGFASNFNMQLVIVLFTMLLTSFMQFTGSTVLNKYSGVVGFMISSLMFLYIFRDIFKENSNEKEVICNISLKVLEQIEKETISINKKVTIKDEVAATVHEVEQPKNQVKPISHQTNGNWNVEINMPSIIDAMASIYKVGKFVRKTFRKKK
jgi:hypothetical protein